MKKILILFCLAFGITMFIGDKDYVEIPSTSIRMRVVAASNDKNDQKEKIIVKSYLEEKIYDITKDLNDYSKIDDVLNNSKTEIDSYLKERIKDENLDLTFTSSYGYNYFPQKEFKGLTYKAGNYKSYVVTLGKGEGENWWCVLFPPLCLVDENVNDYEYHSLIKDTILKYN